MHNRSSELKNSTFHEISEHQLQMIRVNRPIAKVDFGSFPLLPAVTSAVTHFCSALSCVNNIFIETTFT